MEKYKVKKFVLINEKFDISFFYKKPGKAFAKLYKQEFITQWNVMAELEDGFLLDVIEKDDDYFICSKDGSPAGWFM